MRLGKLPDDSSAIFAHLFSFPFRPRRERKEMLASRGRNKKIARSFV